MSTKWRKASTITSFSLSGAMMLLGIYAMTNPQRYVGLVDRELVASVVIMTGFLFFAVGVVFLPTRRLVREVAAVGIVLTAFAVPGVTALAENFEPDPPTRSVVATSEDGKFKIVVEDSLDKEGAPVRILFLESRSDLLSRRDKLGCFNIDRGREFHSAKFTGRTRVAIAGTDRTSYEENQLNKLNKTWKLRFDRDSVTALDKLPKDSCDTSSHFPNLFK